MCWPAWLCCSPTPGRREEGGEVEMVVRVEVLPEEVAEVEEELPGFDAPAAASWLLPAAPTESGPAAASAGTHSCEVSDRDQNIQSTNQSLLNCIFSLSIVGGHLYQGYQ